MSSMMLNQQNLNQLPSNIVEIPKYNRNDIKPTIVHVGVGGN